jgi:hypothetical protein
MIRTWTGILLVAMAASALAADIEKTVTLAGDEIELLNLIGKVEVVPAADGQFTAVVHVRGRDAEPGLVEIVTENGRAGRILIQFPVDKHREYVYPELGNSRTTVTLNDENGHGGWFEKMVQGLGGKRIEVRGKGKGLEVWADVVLSVPRDHAARVELKVGAIEVARVKADLVLDTASGAIDVAEHQGGLVCDTGSGSVKIAKVVGEVLVDTGSGSVRVDDHVGESLKVDTGSGSVEIKGTETAYLYVDTGSGSVDAAQVKADGARIDTGSGSVSFDLLRVGKGKFVVDTGSGGVDLVLPRDASAELQVDTGSGGIDHDLDPSEVQLDERDQLRARLGSGAARIIIDTGSGGVDITRR